MGNALADKWRSAHPGRLAGGVMVCRWLAGACATPDHRPSTYDPGAVLHSAAMVVLPLSITGDDPEPPP